MSSGSKNLGEKAREACVDIVEQAVNNVPDSQW